MTTLEWILIGVLIFAYLICLVTLCTLTFMKGYIVLGILGIFFPLLWFIGPSSRPSKDRAMSGRKPSDCSSTSHT